ncbi:MAG TPA: hydroxymethylglutaryl-CoA synthase family protein [Candidatus Angelobacter sp.]|jgi:polyketide biosynthesis 3-hydroxy-3-methylglutaryl-CoA synthase-like enzyme PksG|nr:hydroxymethylglutaryl-CoA synthase family protein [Candidatus Angelobacter sp.]
MRVGIEALNIYAGTAVLDVELLAKARNIDSSRFENLLMRQKSVALPCEDPVSFGVNAAKPIVDALSDADRSRIEMVITCTESGLDFSKSMSTYIHHYLGLGRNCRLFELKNACYSGTAGLQMAVNFILGGASPGAKALIVCTDMSRVTTVEGERMIEAAFAEPSSGDGAVAMLVSDNPKVFQLDVGASGYYGYEVMDTCRPTSQHEAGDPDLSLLSYLQCCENSYREYEKRVADADYQATFDYLAFHTPFGGMVKGAHRAMMRKRKQAPPAEIEQDFSRRVMPGLQYCQRVGNIMGGTVFLALASTIDNARLNGPQRVGIFAYGSGCCSEFYSGVIAAQSGVEQRKVGIAKHLEGRYPLAMDEYDKLAAHRNEFRFGTRDALVDAAMLPAIDQRIRGKGYLMLKRIKNFHRQYDWC